MKFFEVFRAGKYPQGEFTKKEVAEIAFDGFLCGCGTYLIYRGEVIFQSRLDEQRGKDIISKMYELGLDGILEGIENNYQNA